MSPPPPQIYTLSLHDALPISSAYGELLHGTGRTPRAAGRRAPPPRRCRHLYGTWIVTSVLTRQVCTCPATNVRSPWMPGGTRSEEHTSELQSHVNLVCRLLLE